MDKSSCGLAGINKSFQIPNVAHLQWTDILDKKNDVDEQLISIRNS